MSIGDIELHSNADDISNHSARLLIIAYVLNEEAKAK
jgi:hypothetical protein